MIRYPNERRATGILLANLKGSKKKPSSILDIARACRTLKGAWGFEKMSEFFHVSVFQLRQFDRINDLDESVQELLLASKLGIDASYQISRLPKPIQKEVVRESKGLYAHEIRLIVQQLLRDQQLSVAQAKDSVLKTRQESLTILMLSLTSETYDKLRLRAKESKKTVNDYALKLLEASLK